MDYTRKCVPLRTPISYTTANRSSLSMTTLVLKGFWADVAHFFPEQSCTSNRFKRTKIHVPLTESSHLNPLARSLWMRKRVFISPSLFSKWQCWQNDKMTQCCHFDKMTKWQNDSESSFSLANRMSYSGPLRVFLKHGKYLVYPDIRYRYSFFIMKVTKCT